MKLKFTSSRLNINSFLISVVTKSFREEDPVYRAKILAAAEEKLPFFLTKFEERVKKNGGYFVNDKVLLFLRYETY